MVAVAGWNSPPTVLERAIATTSLRRRLTLRSSAMWRTDPSSLPLLNLPASFLTIAFTGQRLLDAELLARFQVKGVPFDFPDDVLLQNLLLEAAERVLQRLAFLELYFSQTAPPTLTMIPAPCSVFAARADFSRGIIRPLPALEPSRFGPAFPSVPCRA